MAILLAQSVYCPLVKAKENKKEDKIYYWKVYSTNIKNGEEDLIEWINPTIWKGRGYSWWYGDPLGYNSIEFHSIDGENYVFGSEDDRLKVEDAKVGDVFYDIASGNIYKAKRKVDTKWNPAMKNTITSIKLSQSSSRLFQVDVNTLYAYKHIGYARSYSSNTFEKWELERYGEHLPVDYRFYYKRIDTAPIGDVNWIEDEGFQEDYKKKHGQNPDENEGDKKDSDQKPEDNKDKIEELEKNLEEKDKKITELEKQIEELKKNSEDKSKCEEKEKELNKALEDKNGLQKQLDNLKKEKDRLEKENKERNPFDRDTFDRLYYRNYRLNRDNDELESDNTTLRSKNYDLEKQITKLKEENNKINNLQNKEEYVTIFNIDNTLYKTYLGLEFLTQAEMTDNKGYIAPFIQDSRTMLPIRYVALSLGLDVYWNPQTRIATFVNSGVNNVLLPGTVTINANTLEIKNQYGQTIYTDVQPIFRNGRFYVSINTISKAFGGTSGYYNDGIRNTIELNPAARQVLVYKYIK